MPRHFLLAITIAVFAVVFAVHLPTTSNAQTPPGFPTPPAGKLCPMPDRPMLGGEGVSFGAVKLTLPPGATYAPLISAPGAEPTATFCYIEGDSSITISGTDCRELARDQRTPGAVSVLNALRSACTVVGIPPPLTAPIAEVIPGTVALCAPGVQVRGGEAFSLDNVTVRMPAQGAYSAFWSPPPSAGNRTLVICSTDTQAQVQLSAVSCKEFSRIAPSKEAGKILDEIIASCRTTAAEMPQPGARIAPPDAGDAGLLSP